MPIVTNKVSVPILDRPEGRPQPETTSTPTPGTVPILDRPEGRPQHASLIWQMGSLSSNPRSPRRATATRYPPHPALRPTLFQSSIAPKGDRNGLPSSLPTEDFLFQSSIAPKGDRNLIVHYTTKTGLPVPILDRPEGRPQHPVPVLCNHEWVVPILDRPEGRPQHNDFSERVLPHPCSNPRSPRRATATSSS